MTRPGFISDFNDYEKTVTSQPTMALFVYHVIYRDNYRKEDRRREGDRESKTV